MDTEPGPTAGVRARSRRRYLVGLAAVAVTVWVLDQLTKIWAVHALTDRGPVVVVPGWLDFELVRNPGAAFSLSTGTTWLFTGIAVVVVVVILRAARRLGTWWWTVALGLLLGGAVGNLTDRLVRAPGFARGHVVDFIFLQKFPVITFPVFNLADSAITCAAVLIALVSLLGVGLDGTRLAVRPSAAPPPPDQVAPAPDDADRAPERSDREPGR